MTAISELNRRLVLEAPVESADGSGGVTRSYAEVVTLWASLTPIADRADVAAAGQGAIVTHRIVIRAGRDVTTRHRLRAGTRIFRIVAVREQDAGRFLAIHAEERAE
jgi:SPP1 family predicted phage head-tail adaptor